MSGVDRLERNLDAIEDGRANYKFIPQTMGFLQIHTPSYIFIPLTKKMGYEFVSYHFLGYENVRYHQLIDVVISIPVNH